MVSVCHFGALLIVIVSTATPGFSQDFFDLTTDREIVCSTDETVSYTCIVSTVNVQWIAEPFIPATGQGDVVIGNLLSSVDTVTRRTGIVVEHVFLNPFLSRLTINTSVIKTPVDVTCSTLGLTPEINQTLQYNLNGLPKPVSGVNATPIADDMTGGSILVQFVPSPSPGITNYIINCNGTSCKQRMIGAMENDAVVEVNRGGAHTVCVYAVNRCGEESMNNCIKDVEIPTLSDSSSSTLYGFVAAFAISTVSLIVVLVVLIGCCILMCNSQKRIGNESAVGFNRNDGVDMPKQYN